MLARYEVPATDDPILGVQWAGKRSVYLAYFKHGVVEAALREGLPEVRHVLATRSEPPHVGLRSIVRFDVSQDWVVAWHARFAWAPQTSGKGPVVPTVQRRTCGARDFAVDGDTIVMLGIPDAEEWEKTDGGLVWRADLSKGLDEWEVLYENDAFAANPRLLNVITDAGGSLALLADGNLLVAPNAPGAIPPVLRLSARGKVKEVWTAEELWGDPTERWAEGEVGLDPFGSKEFKELLGARRTVDAVLALPEGPAIVVREPKDGTSLWRLGVLSPEVRWYDIPLGEGDLTSVAQLRGDADDDGRIVLVGTIRELHEGLHVSKNQVLVARVPVP
ncbi:MAG: hypothetical protein ACLF0P_07930 [Thermoanaerobaculia bacterium]